MSQTATVTIKDVQGCPVKTKRGQGIVYRTYVEDDPISFDTFQLDISQAAEALTGQQAVLEFEEVQNGEYTNRRLLGVSDLNGHGSVSSPVAPSSIDSMKAGADPSSAS